MFPNAWEHLSQFHVLCRLDATTQNEESDNQAHWDLPNEQESALDGGILRGKSRENHIEMGNFISSPSSFGRDGIFLMAVAN